MQSVVIALLFCSASAISGDIREVSPEEFHELALRQISEGKPKVNILANTVVTADTKNEVQKEQKKAPKKEAPKALSEEEKKVKRETWLKNKAQRQADGAHNRNVEEEKAIQADEAEKAAALNLDGLKNVAKEEAGFEAQGSDKVEEKVEATTVVAKANKTYACQEKPNQKEVLTFYLSGLSVAPTKANQQREKCMKSQLAQHCLPYEKVDTTYIEPCDATDYSCLQKRVTVDHPDCLNRNVDWDSIRGYAQGADKGMMEVLSGWCSRVKVLKEVQRRSTQDEEFVKDYPAFLMIEDNAVLDKEYFEEIVKDWVNNNRKPWDMVQLDTHGGKAHTDKVGDFRGKAIYRPSWKAEYGGFHAVLVKTASISTLLEKMQTLNVVPVEWVQKSMNDDPKGLELLSWDAGISGVEWNVDQTTKEYMLTEQCKIDPRKIKEDKPKRK